MHRDHGAARRRTGHHAQAQHRRVVVSETHAARAVCLRVQRDLHRLNARPAAAHRSRRRASQPAVAHQRRHDHRRAEAAPVVQAVAEARAKHRDRATALTRARARHQVRHAHLLVVFKRHRARSKLLPVERHLHRHLTSRCRGCHATQLVVEAVVRCVHLVVAEYRVRIWNQLSSCAKPANVH